MSLIKSEDLSIDAAFNHFYVVPDYQRQYVWQEEQVTQFFDDIFDSYDALGKSPATSNEYFIGSIVTCEQDDKTLQLVDGQQRLTTLYLFLCALNEKLVTSGDQMQKLNGQIKASTLASSGEERFRYRVELQYVDSRDVIRFLAEGKRGEIPSEETLSTVNLKNAYDKIEEFLGAKFSTAAELKRFYAYLNYSVKLIRVEAYDISRALRIFETINARGVGLDAMDLFKNLLFMQATSADFDDLKDVWRELSNLIYKANEKPLRFLRYFIIADYDVERIREDDIYSWMVKNKQLIDYERKPVEFAKRLREAAKSYVSFLGGKTPNGIDDPSLKNIQKFAGSSRQFIILLLAMRSASSQMTMKVSKFLEDLLFAYTMVREPAREYEKLFGQWAPKLRALKNEQELDEFMSLTMLPELRNLKPRFMTAFTELNEATGTRAILRYSLAKLTQWFDGKALGSESPLETYYAKGVEVEHISPRRPEGGITPENDLLSRRLGNLALVEKPINAAIGNKPFAEKRDVYLQSAFWLTKVIGKIPVVGVNTSIEKTVQLLTPMENVDAASIVLRQEQLTSIALRVWSLEGEIA